MDSSQDPPPPPTPRGSRGSGSEASCAVPTAKRPRTSEAAPNTTLALVAAVPTRFCVACGKSPRDTDWHSTKVKRKNGVVVDTEYVGNWCTSCRITSVRAYPLVDPDVIMADNLADPKIKAAFLKADSVRRRDEKPNFVQATVQSAVDVGFTLEQSFDFYDEPQFRARFRCSPSDVDMQYETFTMPSGAEVTGVAVSIPGPLRLKVFTTTTKSLNSLHLDTSGHIRQEQASEVHQYLIKQQGWPKRKSEVEVEAAVMRADAIALQRAVPAVDLRSSAIVDGSPEEDAETVEFVVGQPDGPSLLLAAGGGYGDKSSAKRRVTARRRIVPPRRSPADGDSATATWMEGIDGSASSQKKKDDTSSADSWITRLDVENIIDGTMTKVGIHLREARKALERMLERGEVGEAVRLEQHLKVSAAALELQRYKTMQKDELLATTDVLEESGYQVPSIIGVEILKISSRPKPGSPSPDAAEVLDMLWLWPQDPSAPRGSFLPRDPKLCDLGMTMSESVAAFKACYVDSYLGALMALGPGCDITIAARLFLARWEDWTDSNQDAHLACPGRYAAKGIAPLA